jgi:uncharacterized protein (TIGR03086 family)
MSSDIANRWDALDSAHHALRVSVEGVAANAWQQRTPCDQWNVTQVFQHAAGDQLGWAAAMTGGSPPSEDPFAPSGHLTEPVNVVLERALHASARACATIDRAAAAVPTPLPQGPLPAPVAVGACALDAAIHAWDIAVATGQPSPLTGSLAASLMPVATAIVEPLRAYGAYAAALEPGSADGAPEALLRYLGRHPDWTP